MKSFFYLLTFGGLLWLFFNPNGILKYNTQSKEADLLIKQLKQNEEERNQQEQHLNWLTNFIKSIEENDKIRQKHILEKYGADIGIQLILRNFFKENSYPLKIKKGLKK